MGVARGGGRGTWDGPVGAVRFVVATEKDRVRKGEATEGGRRASLGSTQRKKATGIEVTKGAIHAEGIPGVWRLWCRAKQRR